MIILVSAHWEEDVPTITSSSQPPLIYDYYGFPREAYKIEYPAKGHPTFAQRLQDHMTSEGIVGTKCSDRRGFDHGMFVPMKLMYPNADIPCIQLSLVSSLDPKVHIDIGQAVQKFTQEVDENVLVIGSGFSFHNLQAFFDKSNDGSILKKNVDFDSWLQQTVTSKDISEEKRKSSLLNWESEAPYGRYCHPREEHLLPLHVCYGVTGRASDDAFSLNILGKRASMFLWNEKG